MISHEMILLCLSRVLGDAFLCVWFWVLPLVAFGKFGYPPPTS